MSEREKIQNELVALIESRSFDAPYGALTHLKTLAGGGKARQITFGKAATLDATITIWSPKRFTVEARGPYSQHLDRDYDDLNVLKSALMEIS